MGIPQQIIERMPLSVQDPINRLRYSVREDKSRRLRTEALFRSCNSPDDVRGNLDLLLQLHDVFPVAEKKSEKEDYLKAGATSLQRLRYIDKLIPLQGKDILEIGAGYGETLFHKEKVAAKSMTGVDFPSARKGFEALQTLTGLRENESLRYLTGSFLDVEFAETNRFDMIFSFDTFEHFDDPAAIFDRARTLLRKGGHMVFLFGPLFRSPKGAHRYYYTGIPYFQNLFNDETVFEFFNAIDATREFSNHKGFDETLKGRNPFSEMNRWKQKQFIDLFSGRDDMEVSKSVVIKNYRHISLTPILHPFMTDCAIDDLYATSIFTLLRKKT